MIHKNQKKYHQALEESDSKGEATPFLKFSLKMIASSLKDFSEKIVSTKPKANDRIEAAAEHFLSLSFSRKDYMKLFKEISSATASRDLAEAVSNQLLILSGTKAQAKYKFRK